MMRQVVNKVAYFSSANKVVQGEPNQKVSQSKALKFNCEFDVASSRQKMKERNEYFEYIKEKNKGILNAYVSQPINIKLKDGKIIKAEAFKTTPFQICRQISKKLAENTVVTKIKYARKSASPFADKLIDIQKGESCKDGEELYLADLHVPLQGDCQLQFLSFEDEKGKETFWHSSAHVLGQALENVYGAWLCHGPPLNKGFFYDSFIGDHTISQENYDRIQRQVKKIIQEKQSFERIILSKNEALRMFAGNPYKEYLINSKIPDNGITSAYKCGSLIDLCTGPHLPSTDRMKGYKIIKNSSSYFLGNKENDQLQRLYAISFPKQGELDAFLKNQEELAKRDHRTIGHRQHLFTFTQMSPGSALFLPHGTIIYNRLIELMRSQYTIRGYREVISPNLYHSELWKTSGHYFKYKENIFFFKQGEEEQGLKPMNCPGHCLMFDQVQYSYRDLPVRMADFGVLHRNELTGALSGLTRVRRFQQDDAHIFCRPDQIEEEILGVLDLLDYVYTVFGFKYVLELSTRPEKYLGALNDWEKAESQLKQALHKFGKQYKVNEGDGAFYGPKIDIKLFDAFDREHQCGTIQLDFQLPQRFDLQYRTHTHDAKEKKEDHHKEESSHKHHEKCDKNHQHLSEEEKYSQSKPLKNGFERPVIIHRAIFGSLQRFIAILCEHNGGKWDFWISPRQIKLLSIGHQSQQYVDKVYNTLLLKGYSVEKDMSQDNLGKKIRNAQLEGFNYMAIIGQEEVKNEQINIRSREGVEKKVSLPQLLEEFTQLKPIKSEKRKAIERNAMI